MSEKIIEKFYARGDDGRDYPVTIVQKFIVVPATQTTEKTEKPGQKQAKSGKELLTRIDDNTFRIDKTGVILRRQ